MLSSLCRKHSSLWYQSTRRAYSLAPDGIQNSNRSAITSSLWEKRVNFHKQQLAQFANTGGDQSRIGVEMPSHLLQKKPSDSYVEIELPFSTDKELQEEYVDIYGGVRCGKLLEDIDALAGNIAHLHADDNNPVTRPLQIVTASVDRIDLLGKLSIDRNLLMRGNVCYVGSSSMEVCIEIVEKFEDKITPIILAAFTMVAKNEGKSAPVNQLALTTEGEKALFAQGEKNKRRRAAARKSSLSLMPPTPEEKDLIHKLFVSTQGLEPLERAAQGLIEMTATRMQSVVICEQQEKNLGNKIFGGWLMHEAYKIAFVCAHQFLRAIPSLLAFDEVDFIRPVEIGSILSFNSQVIYSEGSSCCIMVSCEKLSLTGKNIRTNVFTLTFTSSEPVAGRVIPNTYAEAILYLEGYRLYLEGKEASATLNSPLLSNY